MQIINRMIFVIMAWFTNTNNVERENKPKKKSKTETFHRVHLKHSKILTKEHQHASINDKLGTHWVHLTSTSFAKFQLVRVHRQLSSVSCSYPHKKGGCSVNKCVLNAFKRRDERCLPQSFFQATWSSSNISQGIRYTLQSKRIGQKGHHMKQ